MSCAFPFLHVCLCVSSAVETGEAAAEEREDALQGPLGIRQGEGCCAFPTRPQCQQWGGGRRVFGEGALGQWGEGAFRRQKGVQSLTLHSHTHTLRIY